MSGERRVTLPSIPAGGAIRLEEQRFIPRRYEPNYAYPLLVLLHGRGGDEHQLVRSVPALSWRNYVAVGLRGPEVIARQDGSVGYGWGPSFSRGLQRSHFQDRCISPGEIVRQALEQEGPIDFEDWIEEGVFGAVRELRRSLHIHSERIYVMGVGEGAAVAYRIGLRYPERFAGIIAVHGWLPSAHPVLTRLQECREQLRILSLHGEWNGRVPIDRARREVGLLRSAGLRVAFQSYPCANRLTAPMLADVDRWLIQHCTAGT